MQSIKKIKEILLIENPKRKNEIEEIEFLMKKILKYNPIQRIDLD
jgi:hypothetical protein